MATHIPWMLVLVYLLVASNAFPEGFEHINKKRSELNGDKFLELKKSQRVVDNLEVDEERGQMLLKYSAKKSKRNTGYTYPGPVMEQATNDFYNLIIRPDDPFVCFDYIIEHTDGSPPNVFNNELADSAGTQGEVQIGMTHTIKPRHPVILKKMATHSTGEGIKEAKWYERLGPSDCFPKLFDSGYEKTSKRFTLALELMAMDYKELQFICGGKFSLSTSIKATQHILKAARRMYNAHMVHRDLKGANVMVPMTSVDPEQPVVPAKVIDFGLSEECIPMRVNTVDGRPYNWIGTVETMSKFAHAGYFPHYRDDLHSVWFMLTRFLRGPLRWENLCRRIKAAHYGVDYRETNADVQLAEGVDEELNILADSGSLDAKYHVLGAAKLADEALLTAPQLTKSQLFEIIPNLMQKLAQEKEDHGKDLLQDYPELEDFINHILNLGPDSEPNFDLLEQCLENLKKSRNIDDREELDWNRKIKNLFQNNVIRAKIWKQQNLETERWTMSILYEPFYGCLLPALRKMKPHVKILDGLNLVATQYAKNPAEGNLGCYRSREVTEHKIEDLNLADFPDLPLLDEMDCEFAGFGYLYDKNATFKIVLLLANKIDIWTKYNGCLSAPRTEVKLKQLDGLAAKVRAGVIATDDFKVETVQILPIPGKPFDVVQQAFEILPPPTIAAVNQGKYAGMDYNIVEANVAGELNLNVMFVFGSA